MESRMGESISGWWIFAEDMPDCQCRGCGGMFYTLNEADQCDECAIVDPPLSGYLAPMKMGPERRYYVGRMPWDQ